MSVVSSETVETLISLCASDENFYVLTSTINSLHSYLKHNYSPRCESSYLRLIAYLFETYLSESKKLSLCQRLKNMIFREIKDNYATQYFNKRFSDAEIFDLVKHHHILTGKRLILINVDYERQKFKLSFA